MSHAQIVSIGNRAIELLSNNIVPWINDPENGRDLSLRAYNARTHRKYNILNTLMLGRAGAWLTKTHIFDLNRELGLIDDPEHRISFAGVKPHSVLMWFKPRRDERNENDQ